MSKIDYFVIDLSRNLFILLFFLVLQRRLIKNNQERIPLTIMLLAHSPLNAIISPVSVVQITAEYSERLVKGEQLISIKVTCTFKKN